jgi:hypothetical protein
MDQKIDSISQDISTMKIKDVEQFNKLNNLEEKLGVIAAKNININERLKKIEAEFVPKKDMDNLFKKVRGLEETPNTKTINKIEFIKKAILAGLTIFITGAVVGLGTYLWKLVVNIDTIIEVIEKLK